MLRASPASSMQKTYDDCYLICSTAVYFEKQNNEDEALRSWRSALDNIYYFNAYKMSPNYRPKNETEKALQDSLVTMERQCKERVDLLEALKKSREEPNVDTLVNGSNTDKLRTGSSSSISTIHSNGARQQLPPPYSNPQRPQMPVRPQTRPLPPTPARSSAGNGANFRTQSYPQTVSPSLDPPSIPVARSSRTPSPDKRSNVLKSTLRSGTREAARGKPTTLNRTMRSSKPTAAGKAATLAWPGAMAPQTNNNDSNSLTSSTTTPAPAPAAPQSELQTSSRPRRTQPPSSFAPRPTRASRADPFAGFTSSNEFTEAQPTRREQNQTRPLPTPLSASGVGGGARVAPLGPPTPPIRPTQDLPIDRTANSNGSVGSTAQALEPLADFPSYRKEFSKPERMETKKAQSLAALMNANHITTIDGGSGRPQASAVPSRKAPPPIPRKAVPRVDSQRPDYRAARNSFGEMTPSSGSEAEGIRQRRKKREDAEVLTESVSTVAEPSVTESAEWDAKVQYLMKNLPRGVDEQAAKAIFNEIVIKGDEVHWDDVAGLDIAKTALKEAVVYPFLRPDLFMGLREPARGMLLFGPPGTGKTMLARAVATESRSTFFAISASSLTSKFLGESEKLVRALFSIAKALAPSIIFVDEIDSLLSARGGSSEHEATRRIKTEFLIQWSDLAKAAAGRESSDKTEGDATRVLVLAATNLPWAIDEAARRRFVRRQYIPLPEDHVRESQLRRLMSAQKHHMSDADFEDLVVLTDGFSGSDITALAKDAAMGPLRSLGEKLLHMAPEDIRPISIEDFKASLMNIRPSVSKQGLKEFDDWAKEFGERGG